MIIALCPSETELVFVKRPTERMLPHETNSRDLKHFQTPLPNPMPLQRSAMPSGRQMLLSKCGKMDCFWEAR